MENTRTILLKVTSSYSRYSMAKWRVSRLIYPTEVELHRYTEKICREEQTLISARGNDVYTFSQIFRETNDIIKFFQNII